MSDLGRRLAHVPPTHPPSNKGLLCAKDGNFYDVTPQTSSYYGFLFKVTPARAFTTLQTFNDTDGKDPESVLVQGSDGFLYGTTEFGGPLGDDATDAGTVIKLNTDGSGFQTLHVFVQDNDPNSLTNLDYPTGRLSKAGLTVGPDGNHDGTTSDGGGAQRQQCGLRWHGVQNLAHG